MNWHRLFGLVLTDFFTGSPYTVEVEKDLSNKQQFLDVVVIRKNTGVFNERLPDGMDDLAEHNLISFKSHHEAFDAWTVNELIGHYVNYRKQVNEPDQPPPPPQEAFRLYGVCARFPQQLAAQVTLDQRTPGVFECRLGIATIRMIVLRDLPDEEHNAALHLFSAQRDKVQYGQRHYKKRSPTTSTVIHQLLAGYRLEGTPMPYTMEDFQREVREEAFKAVTVEQLLEELVQHVPPEKLLAHVPIEKRFQGIPRAEIEAYLQKLKKQSPDGNE